MFGAWGRLVYKFRWPVLLGSLALFFSSAVAVTALGTQLDSGNSIDDRMESAKAHKTIDEELPAQGANFVLIFTPKHPEEKATDPGFAHEVSAALAPLEGDPRVARIDRKSNSISRDGRRAFVTVEMRDKLDEATRQYADIRSKVSSQTLSVVATGEPAVNATFTQVSKADLRRAEIVGLPLVLILLACAFGAALWRLLRRSPPRRVKLVLVLTLGSSLVALVPIVVGTFAIVGGVAGIYALAHQREMSIYTLNIASMIGLGLAIDYSLFLISRFLDEVADRSVGGAVERTLATTGKAVAFSGLTVAIGVAGLLFYHASMLNSIGLGAMMVVATSLVYSLMFLPALLSILGNRISARATARHARRGAESQMTNDTVRSLPTAAPPTTGVWHTLATGVMRRPVAVLVPLLALMLLVGSPFLRLEVGLLDATVLPERAEVRQGFDLLTEEFPGGETTSIPVVVRYSQGRTLEAERVSKLHDYSRWLAGLPDVARVQSVVDATGPDGSPLSKQQIVALLDAPEEARPEELQDGVRRSVGERVVQLVVHTPLPANSHEARDLVERIRAGGGPDTGGQVLVGGRTALAIDFVRSVKADSAAAVGFTVAATYLTLALLLGSLVLPLKAVVMNLLSISASYGALVWIFQDGHLSDLLNFSPGPINPTVPVLMFCLLFGLSMDYEVLLLSRMKEEYDRVGDNRLAVARGLAYTGRSITSAAAIMIAVFVAFALADNVIVKALGLGMALAVAIDALVVRTLLVPATMRLLGKLNWWAPVPLTRLHRSLGLGHEEHVGPPAVTAPYRDRRRTANEGGK